MLLKVSDLLCSSIVTFSLFSFHVVGYSGSVFGVLPCLVFHVNFDLKWCRYSLSLAYSIAVALQTVGADNHVFFGKSFSTQKRTVLCKVMGNTRNELDSYKRCKRVIHALSPETGIIISIYNVIMNMK